MFKFGDLFRAEKKREEELEAETAQVPESPAEEEAPAAEEETAPAAEAPAEEEPYLIHPVMALDEIWSRWKEEEENPGISLLDGRTPQELHLTPEQLEEEQDRLEQKLEKNAKLRLQMLRSVEEKGNTAALAASCLCLVSKNRLVAWSFAFPPTAYGDGLTESDIRRTLSKAKVAWGIDDEAVRRAADPENYYRLIPVALGTPAIEGENGRIVEYFPREVVKEVVIREDDTADYRAQCYMQVIGEGETICDIILPVPGEEGTNVEGAPVKPKSVKAAHVPKGAGTRFSEDGLHVLADRDGHLEYKQECFHVQPVLDIPGDVDYSTGNLNFPGNIHIMGDVREGFRVVARGSLMIDGLVEGAEITAGSDLVITKGVVGDTKAVLRCGGSLRTKYLESCTVYAGESVFADCAVNADIHCDDTVSITNGRGSLIGGTAEAGIAVKAKLLGARSGRVTALTLGTRPYLMLEVHDIDRRLEEIGKEAEEAEKAIRVLSKATAAGAKDRQLARTEELERLREEQGDLEKRREEILDIEVDLDLCRVECETVFPITTVTVDGKVWILNNMQNKYEAVYDKKIGELQEKI